MKAPAHVQTPAQYLDNIPAERRTAIETLHRAILQAVPELTAHICHGMLGYGPVHYRTRSGCEGDWAVIGLASQKHYISLYLCASDDTGYLAEQNKARLGKVSVGKSCIRFSKLEDLNLQVAIELVKKAAQLSKNLVAFTI